MLLVFFAAFRSVAAAVIPLIEVGACLVTVFGLMGWCGVPIYLTVAVMPVILTSMGVADEIHIFHHYAELLRATPGQPQRTTLRTALDEMWVPVVKTSVTTAIGFLSFALSPLGPVQAFGLFTAVGIIFCMTNIDRPINTGDTKKGSFWLRSPIHRKGAPLSSIDTSSTR